MRPRGAGCGCCSDHRANSEIAEKKQPQRLRDTEKNLTPCLCVSVANSLRALSPLRVLYQENRNITCVVRMNPPCETIVPKAELPCVVFIWLPRSCTRLNRLMTSIFT